MYSVFNITKIKNHTPATSQVDLSPNLVKDLKDLSNTFTVTLSVPLIKTKHCNAFDNAF